MTTKDTKPAALTAAKQTGATGTNQDGNAAHVEDSTIAAALNRIADELHELNGSLTLTRNDGTVTVTLAQLLAERMRNGRVVLW